MRKGVKIVTIAAITVAVLAALGIGGLLAASKRPAYCNQCHVMQSYYQTWSESAYLARSHAQADLTCQDCHPQSLGDLTREIVLTVTHRYDEPLRDQKVPKEQCLACHGDYDQLAEATSDRQPNPHRSHLGQEECFRCHKMHKMSPGLKYCLSCHHTGDYVSCKECHKDR